MSLKENAFKTSGYYGKANAIKYATIGPTFIIIGII